MILSNIDIVLADTITIVHIEIYKDGRVLLIPPTAHLSDGSKIKWTISSNEKQPINPTGTNPSQFGEIKLIFPHPNNPWNHNNVVEKRQVAKQGDKIEVTTLANWPANIDTYEYKLQFTKGGVTKTVDGKLTKSPDTSTSKVIMMLPANNENSLTNKNSLTKKVLTNSLIPLPVTKIKPADKAKDLIAMQNHPLWPGEGWTFQNGNGLVGDFYVTKANPFFSNRSAEWTSPTLCYPPEIDNMSKKCFTVKWVSRDLNISNKNLVFFQMICSSTEKCGQGPKLTKSPYPDVSPPNRDFFNDRPNMKPLYYPTSLMSKNIDRVDIQNKHAILTFLDAPGRDIPNAGWLKWTAHLYIAEWIAPKTIKVYDGMSWGFEVTCGGNSNNLAKIRSAGVYGGTNYPGSTIPIIDDVYPIPPEFYCGDFGDAPDQGLPTGYPSVLSQFGNFPTLLVNDGARTSDGSILFGNDISFEKNATDIVDPDGIPNLDLSRGLPNQDGSEDTEINFFLLITSIPPPAIMSFPIFSNLEESFDMYFNLLIDLTGDGKWEGYGEHNEPEWAVQNLKQTIHPGENILDTPVFPYSDGLKLPPCPWTRATITSEPVISDDLLGWRGTGNYTIGEVEDFVLAVFPEKCDIKPGPGTFLDLPPPLTDPKIPRIDCSPTTKIFEEGEDSISFICKITNFGKSGNVNWKLTKHTGGVSINAVQGSTWVNKGNTVDVNLVASRGDLPSSWTARAVDPESISYSGVIVAGFDESISPFEFVGTEPALLIENFVVPLDEFILVGSDALCTEPYYQSKTGFVTSYSGKKLIDPDPEGCGYGELSSLSLHNVHLTPKDIIDSDFDGIPDEFEEILETDAFLADTNEDGILDGAEDFDGDGLTNSEEINDKKTNPLESDAKINELKNLREYQHGNVVDKSDDHIDKLHPYFDIGEVIMSSDVAIDKIDTSVTINGPFPNTGNVNLQYKLLFNSDGRLDTGINHDTFAGIDDEVIVIVKGDQSIEPLRVYAYIKNTTSGKLIPLLEPQIDKSSDSKIMLSLSIPESKLGISAFDVPVYIVSTDLTDEIIVDSTSLIFDRNQYLDDKKITHVPKWIKNNAGWWADGTIDDDSFIQGIQYLIKEGIMKIPFNPNETIHNSNEIPLWVKNNAGWWADGTIDDDSFIQGIQYLIKEGIMKINSKNIPSSVIDTDGDGIADNLDLCPLESEIYNNFQDSDGCPDVSS